MNWIRRHWALLALLGVLASAAVLFLNGRLQLKLGGQKESRTPPQADSGDAASGNDPSRVRGNRVELDDEAFRLSGIRIAGVTATTVPVYFQAPGEVQIAEDRIAHVTPPIAGVVREVEKGVGDRASKGSPLCSIESAELGDARSSYVLAHAETDIAERNYDRLKALFEKGLRTQNELLSAEAELTRARLKLDATNAKLRAVGAGTQEIQDLLKAGANAVSNRYPVRSPITGSVLQRNVTVGQNVATSDQMFLVADLSEVWVQAVAHEQDLPSLKQGMRTIVRVPTMPDVSVTGKLTYIAQQVDEKSRTVSLRIVARNPSPKASFNQDFLLRPGLFTNIEIETGHRKDALVIPFSAVQSDGSGEFVFVQSSTPTQAATSGLQPDKRSNGESAVAFERRPVQLGVRYGQLVEVIKGLQIGERVAVENAYLLEGELEKSKMQDQD
jgi:membrane fusion protein, heavy metal efflux system